MFKKFFKKVSELFNRFKQSLSVLSLLFVLFLVMLASQFTYDIFFSTENYTQTDSESFDCNVMGIEMRGELYTYVPLDYEGNILSGYEDTTRSEDVLSFLAEAEEDSKIKGILIEVDSYGGSPAAAEEIEKAIKRSSKPVVAFIREGGLSASYYTITSADYIFALKSSDVGSIGVTMSYLDNVFKNQKDGNTFVELATGKFKDAGSPDKPITPEERVLFMRDLEIIHENFIQTISENRNIPLEKIREIADGSSVLGERAKELDLIDEIGDYYDAKAYLGVLLGEDVNVCW